MNSKQLNFFIAPEEREFIADFFIKNNLTIVNNKATNRDDYFIEKVERVNYINSGQLFLTDSNFISNIYFLRDEEKNEFNLDRLRSYLIEFEFGGHTRNDPKNLRRGRFYYKKSYFVSNGETIEKSIAFTNWADQIIKTFKKQFLKKRSSVKGIYFSEKVSELLDNGKGKLDGAALNVFLG